MTKTFNILILALYLAATSHAATFTFTAIERRWAEGSHPNIGSFHAESTVTITIHSSSPSITIDVPRSLFGYQPWPPPTALMFNPPKPAMAIAPPSISSTETSITPSNTASASSPPNSPQPTEPSSKKQWFLNAALQPYRQKQRYDTCLNTQAAPTPGLTSHAPKSEMGPATKTMSANPPHSGCSVFRFQEPTEREFMFFADTEGLRTLNSEWHPPTITTASSTGSIHGKQQLNEPNPIPPTEQPCTCTE